MDEVLYFLFVLGLVRPAMWIVGMWVYACMRASVYTIHVS